MMIEIRTGDQYLQDDLVRGLRTSLIAVLSTKRPGDDASLDFLKGALSLARSQAELYGISWLELAASLCSHSELWEALRELRVGCESGPGEAQWCAERLPVAQAG